jgi:hypothetical protein
MTENAVGDRRPLTGKEIELLDGTILPRCHRWLREYPHLAEHAIKTLTYWAEPVVDDYGRPYNPNKEREQADKKFAQ